MKNYNPIADGSYVREHRRILKELCTWEKMTTAEKQFFRRCHRCTEYNKYASNESTMPCPCLECKHHKTEVQVDNEMTKLRRKYFKGDF
jgi:hypothetical protein